MAQTIWDMLGISPTDDKRAIKKAYAIKCSACHPEEQPEAFDQLHKAYLVALRAASGKAGSSSCAPGTSPSGSPAPGVSAQNPFFSNFYIQIIIVPTSSRTIQAACNLSPIHVPRSSYIQEEPQFRTETGSQDTHHRFWGASLIALMIIIIVILAILLVSITASRFPLTNEQVRSIEQSYLQNINAQSE